MSSSQEPQANLYLLIANLVLTAIMPVVAAFLTRITYSECCGGRLVRKLSLTRIPEESDVVYGPNESE